MTELAFLILLTFASGDMQHVEQKALRCIDAHCVGKMERAARQSPTLTRFRVFDRDRSGIDGVSTLPMFPPIIDWSPM